MSLVALLLANAITTSELQNEFPVLPADEAIVQDAITRWAEKNKGTWPLEEAKEIAMRERVVIVVRLPGERCVILHLRTPNLGGTPVYCYQPAQNALTESSDDVE